ncbi:retrotransposon protein, putative, ty3-gypsy subclass [Tanacetum coccineum]
MVSVLQLIMTRSVDLEALAMSCLDRLRFNTTGFSGLSGSERLASVGMDMTARGQGKLTTASAQESGQLDFNQGHASGSASEGLSPSGSRKEAALCQRDLARLPPTTGRVYATDRDQATRFSPVKLISCYEGTYLDFSMGAKVFGFLLLDTSLEKIEFGIEYINGAEPSHKGSDRYGPVELKELKEQLQEMLENGFIRLQCFVFCGVAPLSLVVKNRMGACDLANYFSMIDLRSGYHRASCDEQDLFLRCCFVRVMATTVLGYALRLTNASCRSAEEHGEISDCVGDFRQRVTLFIMDPSMVEAITKMAETYYGDGGSGGFQIYSDASKKGLGCVLMQHGKVIAYASRQLKPYERGSLTWTEKMVWELLKDYDTNIQYHPGKANVVADALSRKSGMIACFDSIILCDLERLDVELCCRGFWCYWGANVEDGKHTEFSVDDDGVVWFEDRLCVPNDQALREKVMTEAHNFPFTIHPGSTKMYRDLKQYFWWNGMKQDVATFVSKCMICQQVKIEHQRASGLLQPLEIPVWKWDEISMDFVTGLPTTQIRPMIAIWVVVDRLTKSAHFLHSEELWSEGRGDHSVFGKDLLRVVLWMMDSKVNDRLIEGPELIEITNEKVAVAKEKLKEARSRQKSYADKHRRDLEFQVGDRVFLKVSPFRGVKRFGIKGKLSPRFIGPFEILERIGEVSYRLALPPQLSHVHDVFHVSLLRGYHYHPLHVASYPFDQIQPDMSLSEEPESILDRQERVMRNKVIPFVKILWKNHPEREATWETEESMRASYPHFFV